MTTEEEKALARAVADRLDAADIAYCNALEKINGPVIAMLERLGYSEHRPASKLIECLRSHPLSVVSLSDLVILGNLWEAIRASWPDLGLESWLEYLQNARRASLDALEFYNQEVLRIRNDVAVYAKNVDSDPAVVARLLYPSEVTRCQ